MEDTSKIKTGEEANNTESNDQNINSSDNQAMEEVKQMLFNQSKTKKGEQVKENYRFWDTQPVPKILSEDTDQIGPLDTENSIEKERKEPYSLPAGFQWWDVDINKDSDLTTVTFKLKSYPFSFTSS